MNYPLSQTQKGIYVTCMNSEEEGSYNIDFLFKLDDDIDTDRFCKALDSVIEAHPYVKSRLVTDETGEVVFEDHSDEEFHCSIYEVDDIESVRSHFGKDYDLMHDQLFRLELYKTKDGCYLYFDFHHIIFDGYSWTVFSSDLDKAYNGEALEKESVNGFVIAEKEAEARKSDAYQEAKSWYAQEFGGATEVDSMPLADVYGNDEVHYTRAWIKLDTDKQGIAALCEKAGVTESMVFTSAFSYTLSKYSGEDEVLFNTVFHGRSDKSTRRALTMMVKTLPVYNDMKKTPTVVELLQQTSAQIKKSRENSVYSYGDVCTDLGVKSDVNFTYQGTLHNVEITINGRKQQTEGLVTNTPGIKLLCMIMVEDGDYYAWCEYQNNKYSDEFIEGFWDAYQQILGEMCKKEYLADIECCNKDTIGLLDSFNAHYKDESNAYEEKTVIETFGKVAKQYPDNIAAVFKDKKYTYRELDELTDRIGAYIYNKVAASGQREGQETPVVSIIIPRNEYMFILPLAAMKAGCAYQPLDPSYPQERLNFMVKDANAALLIADSDLRGIINEYQGEVILTSELEKQETLENIQVDGNRGKLTSDSLFILLYTSGSTGVPKGVMLEHQNLLCFCHWYHRYYSLTPDDNVAAYASFGFDACMMDLYSALTCGATVHIIPEEIRLDLFAMNDYFEANHITHSFMTTQVGVQFLQNIENHSLKHLSVGGEKLVSVDPAKNYKLHNGYGPTECTIFTTTYQVEKNEPNIPIGKPLDSLQCFVVDKHMHRLPVGAAGELIIVGKQVGRGYLNRPDKTAEAYFGLKLENGRLIVADFNDTAAMRAYHSGDIVRYRQDGNIEFVGRKDGQVKIRGFRIELKEVEAVIRDFPGIKDVTVQAFDDPNGGKYIVAYVVSNGPAEDKIDIDALNQFILEQKPPYMVPAVTMQIERIPLNVNQKVDKKALPVPELGAGNGKTGTVAAPLNSLERELYNLVAGIVNLSPLGETDEPAFSITDILGYVGLTSISSIKLATLIYKKYGVQVNSKTLAKTGTLQSIENEILAKWMSPQGGTTANEEKTSAEVIQDKKRKGVPLSYSQLGVYTECMSNPDSVIYNIPTCITIPEGISVDALKDSVKAVVEAHPYINMHFMDTDNGETVQCPIENYELDIPVKELSRDESASEASFSEILQKEKQDFVRPFNLHEGPLYCFEIVRALSQCEGKAKETLYLLADFHHLIFDGGSLDVFLNQLCKAVDGEKIEAETYDYYQFVDDQEIAPETEKFFAEQLGQIEEASSLIHDVYTPNLPHQNGAVSIETDFKTVDAMCKKLSVSTASAYLAATFVAVSKFVAEETIGICTISNGRSNLKISENFGMFVNTLPLVSRVDVTMSNEDFIRNTARLFADTIDNEDYPFARVASQFGYAANIMFAYQIGVLADYSTKYGRLKLQSLELDLAKFPVAVFIDNTPTDAEIRVEYDKALFSEEMARNFGMAIENVLKGFMTTKVIGDISITNEGQWNELDTYNEHKGIEDYTPAIDETVLSHFENIAKQYPDNIAAVFKDKKYTYRELDELTDRIGAYIYIKVNKTVTPEGKQNERVEPVVSILIHRNEYMFILPLAAMKAGCAYQPLDPSYPQERLNFMVKDANAALLIADSDLKDIINEYQGEVILTSELEKPETLENIQVDGNRGKLTSESLFVLLYTSGSTGVPKGVMLEHQNLLCFFRWYHRYYDITPDDNAASYASFGFDVCMMDLYGALTCGATVYIVPEEIRLDLFAMNDYFEANHITHCSMTTQIGVQFLQNIENHSLKHLSVAGEKLVSVDPSKNYKLHNGYGPTECTILATIYQVEKNEPNIPVGKPLDSLQCFIVDKQMHRLPVGAAGELIIVDRQVGRGYLNRPDKTAEAYFGLKLENGKLIVADFNDTTAMRAYHSGDIVRYRQDGNIEFIGRKDGQVKIRGFRIEMKEVEAVIRDFPGVHNVTVQAYDYDDGGKFIAAFVVSEDTLDVEALNAFIKSQKPPYMVPAVTMQIDEIPLNVNQKVDKKALPKPEAKKAEYVAPENDAEKTFCELFQKVLGLKQVSATDDFFEVGGSSIIALKLVVAANKADLDIVYNDVFDHTTPRALAAFVNKGKSVEPQGKKEETIVEVKEEERSYIGEDGFDYRPLNALLKQNTLDAFLNGERQNVGDVLLTGATGFLGIHVLYDLITNYDGKIYCFVRRKGNVSGEKRLKMQLFYYFERNFNALFDKRIFTIEGDATNEADMKNIDCKVDTVVNCAACVKHFAKGNEIENMNVGSVRNLIAWCLEHDARLVHVSTGSVCGMSVDNFPPKDTVLNEHMFFFGQNLDNQYVHSKFMAERLILDSILHHGLNAKIMRVGNLSARNVDGEFQINFRSNNFMNTLHAFQFMGVVPYSMQNLPTEFSPIDDTAHTILLLSQTPRECIVLHPLNVHKVLFGDVIRELAKYSHPISMVEDEKFSSVMQELMENPENIEKLRSLMAYKADSNTASVMLGYDSQYTSQLLYRMDYIWPITTWDYVQRFIKAIGGLGMFESE